MNILVVIAGIQNTLPGSQGNPTPVGCALSGEAEIEMEKRAIFRGQ